MGGRGTFAAGNNVPYKYKTVEIIEGVKVLQPKDPKSSYNLPVESHSSSSYILLDKAGVFRQYREYNSQSLKLDIILNLVCLSMENPSFMFTTILLPVSKIEAKLGLSRKKNSKSIVSFSRGWICERQDPASIHR